AADVPSGSILVIVSSVARSPDTKVSAGTDDALYIKCRASEDLMAGLCDSAITFRSGHDTAVMHSADRSRIESEHLMQDLVSMLPENCSRRSRFSRFAIRSHRRSCG